MFNLSIRCQSLCPNAFRRLQDWSSRLDGKACWLNDQIRIGGAYRDRTDDPLLAKQVLSQLSERPVQLRMVGRGGLEPPTSRLSGVRSNHLSYRPGKRAVARRIN